LGAQAVVLTNHPENQRRDHSEQASSGRQQESISISIQPKTKKWLPTASKLRPLVRPKKYAIMNF
tara:strand:+ start:395 stop:589 length:195 start_codon:yes stop_codon:yes gene_type:complete